MKTLSKILLSSLTLCLGACDPGDVDFSDGEVAFRPWTSGVKLNTSYIVNLEVPELHMKGAFHKGVRLDRVCLSTKVTDTYSPVCLHTSKGQVWVDKGLVMGVNGQKGYSDSDFVGSRWFVELDYDKNGLIDSTIQLEITDFRPWLTPVGYDVFDYYWAYEPSSATGLITKYLEQKPGVVPMCEPDGGNPEQVGSVLIEHTSINPMTGKVSLMADVTVLSCRSSATFKPTLWGYPLNFLTDQSGGAAKARVALENAIRAVRLDVCGTGHPFTAPGQQVAVDDRFDINGEYDPSLKVEGIVSLKKGFVCIGDDLRNGVTFADVDAKCPGKVPRCKDLGVSHWSDIGADLMTQLP